MGFPSQDRELVWCAEKMDAEKRARERETRIKRARERRREKCSAKLPRFNAGLGARGDRLGETGVPWRKPPSSGAGLVAQGLHRSESAGGPAVGR